MTDNAFVRTVVTGLGWMGSGVGSVNTATEELVMSAQNELTVLAYSMSDGAERLMELVQERLRSGIRFTIVVNQLANQYGQIPEDLKRLAHDYVSHCFVYNFDGADQNASLHAKAVIADRQRAIVGSANLSWNGLVNNHELCLYIEGRAVSDLALTVDRLLAHRFVRRQTW
jgi:phosphatidylserine/phosphatidylglycerophosphate/cardiolipin synthase-like enzyme